MAGSRVGPIRSKSHDWEVVAHWAGASDSAADGPWTSLDASYMGGKQWQRGGRPMGLVGCKLHRWEAVAAQWTAHGPRWM